MRVVHKRQPLRNVGNRIQTPNGMERASDPSTLIHSRLALLFTRPGPISFKMTSATPLSTINDLFRRIAAAANPRAILWQDAGGQWRPISSDNIYQRVRALSAALLDWGVQKGE